MNQDQMQILESLIDQTSLSDVLEAIETIAAEKADHIQTNWQDEELAETWTRASKGIGRVCTIAAKEGL